MKNTLGRRTIHPFPARMAPSIALDALGSYEKSLKILDPMAGSGTVLAVAQAEGHRAFGVDCDPLSVMNAQVWTSPLRANDVLRKAEQVLVRAEKIFDTVPARLAYPSDDSETKKFIRFWFDQNSRRQLSALATAIGRVRDEVTRNALWSSFSRMIITKKNGVSLAMDLSHSRPHKVYDKAPVRPFDRFLHAVKHVITNCPEKTTSYGNPNTDVTVGDSRHLRFRKSTFDVVVTSPPYLNAIDYMRCSKFSLVWMGFSIRDLREIRRESIGSETTSAEEVSRIVQETVQGMGSVGRLSNRNTRLLERYVMDMKRSIGEVSRVLKEGGKAVYVVGNNNLKGVFVSNSEAIKVLAKDAGMKLKSESTRELPPNRRYLPPPASKLAGKSFKSRMRTEVVLEFLR